MWPLRRAYRAVRSVFRRKRKAPKRRKQKSNVRNGLVHVKKLEIEPRISVPGNTTVFGVETFELADLPQYNTYGLLYEEYKITKIKYSWKALTNVAMTQPSATGSFASLGMVHTILDSTDGIAPVSIQTMMNDSSYRGTLSSRTHSRTFTPKFLNQVGINAAVQPKTGWLSTDQPNVSHYAIKWAFEGGITSPSYTSFVLEPIITYYVSFRNPR